MDILADAGRAKNLRDAEKTLDWRERGTPWPKSWKKPVERQAVRMESTTARAAGLLGSSI